MESSRRRTWVRPDLYLLMFFCILVAWDRVAAAMDAPPAWNTGQWWIVESQTYNTDRIRRGDEPGWEPKVRWRFQVHGIEDLAGEPYYIVGVTPLKAIKALTPFGTGSGCQTELWADG